MKIALLNLHYDNNYGGNLQRYALMTVLRRMGHDVTYLYMRFNWSTKSCGFWTKESIQNFIKRYIFLRKDVIVFPWREEDSAYINKYSITDPFLERYISHSPVLWGRCWLERYAKAHHFDAYIVGSDQVWRKSYTPRYGVGMWFFDFLPNKYHGKLIAYGASFGVSEKEYTEEEQEIIRPLYNRFKAVSVREESGLKLLNQYGWTSPKATCVIDPTLLLSKEDYIQLVNAADTKPMERKLWCYILDMDREKEELINQKSEELSLLPTIYSFNENRKLSIEQWLRNFFEAEYVITDSYHGLIFSLIFHKSFYLIVNKERGATRFDSLCQMLDVNPNEPIDWQLLDKNLNKYRQSSLDFLRDALR